MIRAAYVVSIPLLLALVIGSWLDRFGWNREYRCGSTAIFSHGMSSVKLRYRDHDYEGAVKDGKLSWSNAGKDLVRVLPTIMTYSPSDPKHLALQGGFAGEVTVCEG